MGTGYFVEGEAGVTSDGRVFECAAGDMTIQPPGAFHSMWASNDKNFKILIVSFSGDGLDYTLPHGKVKLSQSEIFIADKLMEEIPSVFSGYDVNEFERLQDKASPGNAGYQIVKNYIELLCLSLIRRGSEAQCSVSEQKKSVQFAGVVAYLKENLQNNLTFEDICRGVSESPSSLKAMFRKYSGGGVMKYYNYLRCEYCVKLLRDGRSITDIMAAVNFTSQNYFSYFFKRETGVPPSRYLSQKDAEL